MSENNAIFKVAATSFKLETRLHAYNVGPNTQTGSKVIITLIWLAHAFGTRLLSLIAGFNDVAATFNIFFQNYYYPVMITRDKVQITFVTSVIPIL